MRPVLLANAVGVLLLGIFFAEKSVVAYRYARNRKNPFRDVAWLGVFAAASISGLFFATSYPLFFGSSIALETPRIFCFFVWTAVPTVGLATRQLRRRYPTMLKWNLTRVLQDAEIERMLKEDREALNEVRRQFDAQRKRLWDMGFTE